MKSLTLVLVLMVTMISHAEVQLPQFPAHNENECPSLLEINGLYEYVDQTQFYGDKKNYLEIKISQNGFDQKTLTMNYNKGEDIFTFIVDGQIALSPNSKTKMTKVACSNQKLYIADFEKTPGSEGELEMTNIGTISIQYEPVVGMRIDYHSLVEGYGTEHYIPVPPPQQ